MNFSTAYSSHEASTIARLKWYNDERLIYEIVNCIRDNASNKLIDLCCGSGQLYKMFANYYKQINAIDLSNEMLVENKLLNSRYLNQINYYNMDVHDYLNTYHKVIDGYDILLKNCMQFLSLDMIFELLKMIKFKNIYIVQTVNICKHNFFTLLKENGFSFVNRTHNYVTLEDVDRIINNIGIVKHRSMINQKISLNDWLYYHNCNNESINKFYHILSLLSFEQLNDYGLDIRDDNYILSRNELIAHIIKQ